MTETTTRYEDHQSFLDAEHTDTIVITDRVGELWLAWETENGGWCAVRPRNEDDRLGALIDRYRPVGPTGVETLEYPIRVTVLPDASEASHE